VITLYTGESECSVDVVDCLSVSVCVCTCMLLCMSVCLSEGGPDVATARHSGVCSVDVVAKAADTTTTTSTSSAGLILSHTLIIFIARQHTNVRY